MYKKLIFLLLALALIVPYLPVEIYAASDSVTIHYQRADGEYDQWNIWAWPENGEGGAYPFDGEDGFGKVANITLQSEGEKVGFIVRTDSWEKDFGDDRFIDTSEGTEIWVLSGEGEFSYEPPEGYSSAADRFEEIDIAVSYTRYDGDYNGLSLVYWTDAEPEQKEIPLKSGKLSTRIKNSRTVNFTINKDGVVNDYAEGRFSTSKVNDDGKLEVFLMQGMNKAAYSADSFKTDKIITLAEIISASEIRVRLPIPCKLEDSELQGFSVTDNDGNNVELTSVSDTGAFVDFATIESGYAIEFIITAAADIDLSKRYTISKNGQGRMDVSIGNVFGSESFAELYTYTGDDLGAVYSKASTAFRVWAPTASQVDLLIYENGEVIEGDKPLEVIAMTRDINGTWIANQEGDYKNKYYVYEVETDGEKRLGVDPYAKAVGVNGMRAMVVELAETDPAGFRTHAVPELKSPTDSVIYELHVRDLSMHEHSGITNKGKYLGLTETGTVNNEGLSTGIDHIAELGATHVHLLPSFDYKTIDETKLDENKFNWGYDPQNYNVPEGSYSSDPYNGNVRVNEFKQMVQALHENGLRVVMDVVYNHTFTVNDSNLNSIVPNYYYRKNADGNFSNGSGCGNETASERSMVRKLIVDSVVYWAKEYRIDGFRFDLMGLHDIDTMNEVRAALNEIDPSIIVYGEGWTGSTSPLPITDSAVKVNTSKLDTHIAAFSDDIRDGIKGNVFEENEAGFVNSGKKPVARDEDIRFGIVASVEHPQVDISRVSYSDRFWAAEPTQTITYASAHDNLTLWDKLAVTNKLANDDELVRMNKLTAAITLTSQGIPFFQAGEEMARGKKGNDNSYESPDSINRIDWDNKTKYIDLFDYYKGLIELRKKYPAFRLEYADDIRANISFVDTEANVVAYTLSNPENTDYPSFTIIFNGSIEDKSVELAHDSWDVLVNGSTAGTEVLESLSGSTISIPAKTALVLGETVSEEPVVKNAPTAAPSATSEAAVKAPEKDSKSFSAGFTTGFIAVFAVAFAAAGGIIIWLRRKKG